MTIITRWLKLSAVFTVLSAFSIASAGCFGLSASNSAVSPGQTSAGAATAGGAGSAGGLSGSGSMFVPTSSAVVGRIQKVLAPAGVNCNSSGGNCNKVLTQLQNNLPSTTNPVNATGLDQVPLLVYAACADAAKSSSVFGVNTSAKVSAQLSNLVNAGVSMVNQHVGNLAASGPLQSQVAAVFTQLVTNDVAAGATTSMAFISVCLAANSFGVAMTGF